MRGGVIRSDDYLRFLETIYGEKVEIDASRAMTTYNAISAACGRWLSRNQGRTSYENFNNAVRLSESLAFIENLSAANADFRTNSLPIQLAAMRALGNSKDLADKRMVVPNFNETTYLDGIPSEAKFEAYRDKFTPRDQAVAGSHARKVRDGMPEYDEAFAVLGSYRRELSEVGQVREDTVFMRSDLVEVLDALAARDADGRAVILLDSPENGNTEELEEFEAFRHILARNYAIEGTADVDGAVHSGLMARPAQRIFVVGRRRPATLEMAPEPALRLRSVRDLGQLWTWTSEVIANRRKVSDFYETRGSEDLDGDEENRQENRFQTPYHSASRVGTATTMIPCNLEGATREALERVQKIHPDIDRWVANEIAMSVEQLAEVFSPEQVDAMALQFFSLDNGNAFLLADDTGIGKGRVLAGVMRRSALQGKKVLFLTEKAMNLSDIWRDIGHIGATDDFAPFILNSNVKIIDEADGEVVLQSGRANEIQEAIQHGWPEGCNLVLATFGQFNRPAEVSAKSAWLRNIACDDVILVADEAHNATSTTSNTADNLNYAKDRCFGPVYASATFAKNAKNMGFFSKLFPGGMSNEELIKIISRGGEAMQEIVSAMLAKDGSFVRREHDLSKVTFETEVDDVNHDRNREYTDILAEILSEIGSMSGEFNNLIANFNNVHREQADARQAEIAQAHDQAVAEAEENGGARPRAPRRIRPLKMQMLHFGSPLYNVARSFLAALNVDATVRKSLSALENNQKPVILVDSTLEALVNDLVDSGSLEGGRKPDFKDVLHRTLSQLISTTRKDPEGRTIKVSLTEEYPDFAPVVDRIRAMIDEMPDLNVMVIDEIRDQLAAHGYRVAEITGRKRQIVNGEVQNKPRTDRVVLKNQFNAGELDAIILNQSGATGIDLHAGSRFRDQRQRVMILLQTPGDIVKEMQAWGRVNRFDQVVGPVIWTPQSGLPAELRHAAMRNAKLRRMSANVTSNRDSGSLITGVPDLINSVGDIVCTRFGYARPDIITRLGLAEKFAENEEDNDDDNVLGGEERDTMRIANTLLARLVMLSSGEQASILEQLSAEYYAALDELDANNANPLRSRHIDGEVKVLKRTTFEGSDIDNPARSAFDDPVFLDTIEVKAPIDPLTFDQLVELVEAGHRELGRYTTSYYADMLERRRKEVFQFRLGGAEIDEVLTNAPDSPLAEKIKKYDQFVAYLRELSPGKSVTLMDEGVPTPGIITRVEVPEPSFEVVTSMYRVFVNVPGRGIKARVYHVTSLLHDFAAEIGSGITGDEYDQFEKLWDDNQGAFMFERRNVFNGNIFRAMEISIRHKLGSIGTYHDPKKDARERAIIIKKSLANEDLLIPVRVSTPEVAAELIRADHRVFTEPTSESDVGFVLERSNNGNSIILGLPKKRISKYARIYTASPTLNAYYEQALEARGNRRGVLKVEFDISYIDTVCRAAYESGLSFTAGSGARSMLNRLMKEKDEAELANNVDEHPEVVQALTAAE